MSGPFFSPKEIDTLPETRRTGWFLPSTKPLFRHGYCSLLRPCLRASQQLPGIYFHEATLLIILSGNLQISTSVMDTSVNAQSGICVISPGTQVDLVKDPGDDQTPFSSCMLNFSSQIIEQFNQRYTATSDARNTGTFSILTADENLIEAMQALQHALESGTLSNQRLEIRLYEVLLLLLEQGYRFPTPQRQTTLFRLRELIQGAPDRRWTARMAGGELAMSESTLRRRLSSENTRFETLLLEVRLQHAMMLLQTTQWSIPLIAEACGYQSYVRFSERFRERFGRTPAKIR